MAHDTFHVGDLTAVIGDNERRAKHGAGYIGLFWASYINAPEDKSFYFRGDRRWLQLCSQRHYDQSTVVHQGHKGNLEFSAVPGDALYKSLSPLRFDDPFYYGLFRKHLF